MPARACRGCLATDCSLYNIYKNNLYEAFGDVVGTPIFESDELPQHICGMCFAQLNKFVAFRNRCRIAQDVLEDLNLQGTKLTTRFIRNIDRSKCNLLINLNAVTPISSDLIIREELPNELQHDVEWMEALKPLSFQHDSKSKAVEPSARPPVINLGVSDAVKPSVEDIHFDDFLEDITPVTTTKVKDLAPKPKYSRKRKTYIFDDPKKTEAFSEKFKMSVSFLTKEEQIEDVRARIKHNFSRAWTYCTECGKKFRCEENLQKHIRLSHEDSVGEACEICNCRFPTDLLQKHVRKHKIKISCRQCDYTTNSSISAASHFRCHERTKSNIHPCEVCKEVFDKKTELNNHIAENHPSKLLWCICCGETAVTKHGIANHMNGAHSSYLKSEHKCQECNRIFVSTEALAKHSEFTCNGFGCVMCGDGFESEALWREHVVMEHTRSQFIKLAQCSDCGVKFFGSKPLEKHQEERSCGQGSPCQVCGLSFPSERLMDEHKSEFHPKLYRACESCDKAFDAINYRHHILRVHNIKPPAHRRGLRPQTSTRVWSVRGSIITAEQHVATVDDPLEKKFICHVCGKTFAQYSYLRIHMRIHTGDLPHSCEVCHRRFNRKVTLKEHLSSHTGERPHACHVCPKRFRKRISLARHLLCHSEIRRHICHICGKKFRTSTAVKLHIRGVHLNLPVYKQRKRRKQKDIENDQDNAENNEYTQIFNNIETQNQDSIDSETYNAVNNIPDTIQNQIKKRRLNIDSDFVDTLRQDVDTIRQDVDTIRQNVDSMSYNGSSESETIKTQGIPRDIKLGDNNIQIDGTVYDTFSRVITDGVPRIIKTVNIRARRRLLNSSTPVKDSATHAYVDKVNVDIRTQNNLSVKQNYNDGPDNVHIGTSSHEDRINVDKVVVDRVNVDMRTQNNLSVKQNYIKNGPDNVHIGTSSHEDINVHKVVVDRVNVDNLRTQDNLSLKQDYKNYGPENAHRGKYSYVDRAIENRINVDNISTQKKLSLKKDYINYVNKIQKRDSENSVLQNTSAHNSVKIYKQNNVMYTSSSTDIKNFKTPIIKTNNIKQKRKPIGKSMPTFEDT